MVFIFMKMKHYWAPTRSYFCKKYWFQGEKLTFAIFRKSTKIILVKKSTICLYLWTKIVNFLFSTFLVKSYVIEINESFILPERMGGIGFDFGTHNLIEHVYVGRGRGDSPPSVGTKSFHPNCKFNTYPTHKHNLGEGDFISRKTWFHHE